MINNKANHVPTTVFEPTIRNGRKPRYRTYDIKVAIQPTGYIAPLVAIEGSTNITEGEMHEVPPFEAFPGQLDSPVYGTFVPKTRTLILRKFQNDLEPFGNGAGTVTFTDAVRAED